MLSSHSELRRGDIIIFNKSSGSASFTTIEKKGTYFTPAKRQTRLDGFAIPIKKHELFMYSGYTLLSSNSKERMIRISITRLETNQSCFLSEFYMHKYFVKPKNQAKLLERCQ